MDFKSIMEQNKLAADTILRQRTKGIPTTLMFVMQHDYIERIAGVEPGGYKKDPVNVYIAMQRNIGTAVIDQFIPENPLTMGGHGYEGHNYGATTGAENIVCDGRVIDSPEAVAEHLEEVEFPRIRAAIGDFNEETRVKEILRSEWEIQEKLAPGMVKTGYGTIGFPFWSYYTYGYANYFMAYALFPEVMEKHFSLQADYWLLNNKAALKAYREGGLPPLYRLDHDIADSRGTLVDIKSIDRIWLPHVARCLEPVAKSEINMIWHCDGNLMQMVPRLLDVGIKGFQGFQYEDGMDYVKICRMKTKDGEEPIIWAGVSVTRTLPMGKPSDVKRELKFLVEHGPGTGLFLGGSSSIAPGVPWENLSMLLEGLNYYRKNGRTA